MQRGTKRRSLQPLVALRAMRHLLRDPDATEQVFVIIRALSGGAFERLYRRVMADPVGREAINEPGRLLRNLEERERLEALPEGTLGREYARFLSTENLSAAGLVEASEADAEDNFLDPRARNLSRRLRDMHDLWHVVTGYGRDLYGESALLAFTYAQTRNRGIGFIVVVGALRFRKGGLDEGVRLIRGGYRRGRRAGLLAAADWESLLELPLEEVRRQLGVRPTSSYEPLLSPMGEAAQAQ